MADRYNAVRGTFTNPSDFWQSTDFTPVTNPYYEAEDGGVRTYNDIDLPFCINEIEAQRNAKIGLESHRCGLFATLPLKLRAGLVLQTWQVGTVRLPALWWNDKHFRILRWSLSRGGDGGIGVDIGVGEYKDSVFDWNYGEATVTDPAPILTTGLDPMATGLVANLHSEPGETISPWTFCRTIMLSWGPPHAPYNTAPAEYRARFSPDQIRLRPNVPEDAVEQSRRDLSGYYAHIAALDDCFGRLLTTLETEGLDDNTIVVFTSDHGDMLGSHGMWKKQSPWDESQRIPFLFRFPARFGREGSVVPIPIGAPDIMPTLLGLCGIDIPATVQGTDATPVFDGEMVPGLDGVLLALHFAFHQWRPERGGREYRGVRTEQYTYVRDRQAPWLLYDNIRDPFQQENLCNIDSSEVAAIRTRLDASLARKLAAIDDDFRAGKEYVRERGIEFNDQGDIPIFADRGPVTQPLTGVFAKS